MIDITTPGGPAPENYMDVFNKGRDTNRPLLSLHDVEGVNLFFTLVCHSAEYRQFFNDGRIAVVSFNVHQDLQTGTGLYEIVPGATPEAGRIKVVSETGAMAGMLQRSDFKYLASE
jgi:hypothetical protein